MGARSAQQAGQNGFQGDDAGAAELGGASDSAAPAVEWATKWGLVCACAAPVPWPFGAQPVHMA